MLLPLWLYVVGLCRFASLVFPLLFSERRIVKDTEETFVFLDRLLLFIIYYYFTEETFVFHDRLLLFIIILLRRHLFFLIVYWLPVICCRWCIFLLCCKNEGKSIFRLIVLLGRYYELLMNLFRRLVKWFE